MSVENHIQNLQDVYNKVQALRQFPQTLIKAPTSPLSLPKGTSLNSQYQQIKDIAQALKDDPVQEALRAAKASESANGLKGAVNLRRENRKRRRVRAPSPESPQPYVAPDRQGASLFPPPTADEASLKACDLFDYIRRFNREHSSKLHVWKPTRTWSSPETVDQPVMLRFCIEDIFTAFLTVDQSADTTLITESVTVFGPREKVSRFSQMLRARELTAVKRLPHSQSEYVVYQSISQQLTKMIHSHPQVPLQTLLLLADGRIPHATNYRIFCARMKLFSLIDVWSVSGYSLLKARYPQS
ncbi:hypothetical protein V5O48_001717 [Marasmius crinis-equi]|uniref:Uncharacterized protein n=1 Tax=Marasmius crinis-equi TaxID=585013 RepID=A0ABR3FXS3_9AGAR